MLTRSELPNRVAKCGLNHIFGLFSYNCRQSAADTLSYNFIIISIKLRRRITVKLAITADGINVGGSNNSSSGGLRSGPKRKSKTVYAAQHYNDIN